VTGTIEHEWNTQMNKAEMKEAILQAKFEKGLKWSDIAKAAGMSPEYLCSACLGMNHLDKKPADAVAKVLGLRKDRRRVWRNHQGNDQREVR
jgi:cyanate lyase